MVKVWRVVNVGRSGNPELNETWEMPDERFRNHVFIPKADYVIIANTPDVCVRLLPLHSGRKMLQLFYAVDDD